VAGLVTAGGVAEDGACCSGAGDAAFAGRVAVARDRFGRGRGIANYKYEIRLCILAIAVGGF